MEDSRYKDMGMVSRLYAKVTRYSAEKDYDTDQVVHYFDIKQIHGKYEMIMDWEYKVNTGREPNWGNWSVL